MSVEKGFVRRGTNKHVLFLLVAIITILFINIFICLAKSYADSAITITSITPNSGPISGGQTVTVSGTGFYQTLKFSQILEKETAPGLACGISAGKVYCWGANDFGQLGNGDTTGATQYSPVAVDTSGVLNGKTITQISSGSCGTTIALASDGKVYSWGRNDNGQLGNGDTTGANQYSPVAVVTSGVLNGKTITQISSGDYGTIIALASDGTVYSWGRNDDGQLGNGDTTGANQYSPVAVVTSGVLKDKTITQISSGSYGTRIALASDGTAYGWGLNNFGQLGNGDTTGANQYSPVAVVTSGVLNGKTITQISSGGYITTALASNGTVYSWGLNDYGQLGNGDTTGTNQYSPVAVVTSGVLNGKTITQISSGSYGTTIALASDGTAYGWGHNDDGQLGNGDTTGAMQYSPVAVITSGALNGKTITQISLGSYSTTIALASDGTVYGWGANNDGQLGNDGTTGAMQYSPVAVDTSGVLNGKTITQISASSSNAITALSSDGTVYTWGNNSQGQLGNGDTTGAMRHSPVAVVPISGLNSINTTLGGNTVEIYSETANSFQFTTPAHAQGIVDFTISSPGYGLFTLAKSYTYLGSGSTTPTSPSAPKFPNTGYHSNSNNLMLLIGASAAITILIPAVLIIRKKRTL